MAEKLKPCPFVERGEDHDLEITVCIQGVAAFAVRCFCGGRGPLGTTKEEAISLWNRRAPDPAVEKAREARRILEDSRRIDTEADDRGEPPAAATMRLWIKDALALLGEVE
jgi:hypothetical protein